MIYAQLIRDLLRKVENPVHRIVHNEEN